MTHPSRHHHNRTGELKPSPEARRRAGSPRGFTLVEMVVSLAVISVLLVGMSSAIVLASKALPHATNPARATVDSARALHDLRDELRAATELPVFSETSVTLHLPDRDGDGRPEVVTYAWAGTPGTARAALTRAANGAAALTVLDNVENFALSYVCGKQDTVFLGPPGNTSAEQLLSSYEAASPGSYRLPGDNWIGAQIAPTFPAGTSNWRITRALFSGANQGGSGSTITFELRGWAGSEPDSTVLESVDMDESTMSGSFEWHEALFTGDVTFTAGQTASLVLTNHGGGDAGKWQYDENGPSPRNVYFTTDEGATWEPGDGDNDNHLLHFVYGTYDIPGDDWTFTRQRVTEINIELVHGGADAVTHKLTLPLANAPEAGGALWDTDFNAGPTTLDYDGDGVSDWVDSGTFDTANLDDGRWEVTDTLFSNPPNFVLDEPFMLDVWLEDTQDNGEDGGVRLRFDQGGGQQGCALIKVNLEATGQVVTVEQEIAAGSYEEKINQTVEAGDAVRVTLAVDPANDTVGVMVNGEVVGTYTYEPFSSTNGNLIRPFTGTNSGVWIDHLRLSTGGTVAITPGAYATSSGASGSSGSGTGGDESAEKSDTTSSSTGSWWTNLFK